MKKGEKKTVSATSSTSIGIKIFMQVTPTPRLTSSRARAAGFAEHTLHAIDVRAQRTSASDHEREVRKKGGRES